MSESALHALPPEPAVEAPATTSWPMTAAEARDLSRAQANLAQVQAQFNAVASAFAKREGLPDGTKVAFDIEACTWRREP